MLDTAGLDSMIKTGDEAAQILDWQGPDDPSNPFNWPKSRKIIINVLCLLATLSCNANATALTVAWRVTNPIYGISDDVFPNSYWAVSSWTLGGMLFMLFLLPVVEEFSIMWGYLIAYTAFIIVTVPQAVVKNFGGFLVLRFLAGGCVALVANCIVGISCDMWVGERGRNMPVASYITAYLCGTPLGPVVGAAILQHLDWTWIIWIQAIWHTVLLVLVAAVLRETRGPILLRRKAQKLRRSGIHIFAQSEVDGATLAQNLTVALKRPGWLFMTEFVVFAFTLWSSFAIGLVFLFTQSTELVFDHLYGWTSIESGYVQVAIIIGMLLAWPVQFYSKHIYFASANRNNENPGQPIPEAHLYISILGSFVGVVGGMFVYGWTAFSFVPWIGPAIGLAMVGFGINTIVMAVTLYITACYSKFAISACAAIGAGENLVAAFLPLAAVAMYSNLGFNWSSSLLGLLSVLLSMAPVVLVVWGRRIRAKSPFIIAASYDTEKTDPIHMGNVA